MRNTAWDTALMCERRVMASLAFGPRTCACVAVLDHLARFFGPGAEAPRAWPLCPHCAGMGVDARVKEGVG